MPPDRLAGYGEALSALRRGLIRAEGYTLFLAVCEAQGTIQQTIDAIRASLPEKRIVEVDLSSTTHWLSVVAESLSNADVVMLRGIDKSLADERRRTQTLAALNLDRDAWRTRVGLPVVCWVNASSARLLTTNAPDFFDWRSDTLDFPELTALDVTVFSKRTWEWGADPRMDAAQRTSRIAELRKRLALPSTDQTLSARGEWLDELADHLSLFGELDEALRIRREEALPVYERLGDVRERAVTMGKIADIFQARGELDEALRIRREEALPVYERLGDVRSRAVTMGRIADALIASGGLTDGRIQEIYEALAESFSIVQKLGLRDGIGYVGMQLAQVLATGGMRDEALAVLSDAENALRSLQHAQMLANVQQLRERISAMTINDRTPS